MKVFANDRYDLDCIVSLLEDTGYISHAIANAHDRCTSIKPITVDAPFKEVKQLLTDNIRHVDYPYQQFYIEE